MLWSTYLGRYGSCLASARAVPCTHGQNDLAL